MTTTQPSGNTGGGLADPGRPGTPRDRYGWPVYAWGLWDWGSAAFNAVITTFVFSVYITSKDFGPGASSKLGWALAGAGVLIALFAPISGQRADRSGRRTFWLAVNTGLVILATLGLFFVKPSPDYLWLGLLLLAAGNVFFELASVNYNAMLNEISTPATVGRISGLGWGLGYLGGIVLLLIVYFGLISPKKGLFGVTSADGLDVRVTMLFCAVWTLVFSVPLILTLRDDRAQRGTRGPRMGVLASYRALFATIADLWRTDRNTVYFLGASAVFRDGLAGVFTFGAVIAAKVFGFSASGVIVFGIAANVVAGIATIAFGHLDDRIGPKRVIVLSLSVMLLAGTLIFFLHDTGTTTFWVCGLALCIFVGPAQSASRTFLARLIPAGREGQVFGLYATTGRAVSFLAPAAFASSIWIGAKLTGVSDLDDAQHWGILGIVTVLLLGLLLLLPVRSGVRSDSALVTTPPPG
ncbi:MFS transporter [Nocardioides sp. dk4132]|uniref:MFS transporter n=1 Tax=unclassified Nocardioides TaxID=2615069 RepID=UPI0012963AAF|nr:MULTISPECIES: MFS transporter [unclassified Nocardioides]MQW75186.1 MFS transporter [Nocardioides sp. dk4132]QGA07658.1 MFS transporter [Nocardioides sp. dk884]